MSRHIRTLEEHFGCRLFERHGRQLQLTEPARLLLPGLRDGFDALERACTALRVDDATLRLKAPSTTLRWLLPRLSRFRHLNPDIEVQLTSAWMDVDSVDFQREPFDCAVLLGSGQFSPEWETAALFAEWLVPVCDPDGPWSPGPSNACVTAVAAPRAGSSRLATLAATDRAGEECRSRAGCSTRWNWASSPPRELWRLHRRPGDGRRGCRPGPHRPALAGGGGQRRSYHLVWPRARRGQERFQRLRDFLLAEVAAMRLPSSSGWRDAAGQLLALTRRYRSLPSLGRAQGLR